MPPIVLLTDFGTQDHYAGVVKGVILSIQPQVPIVDLSHAVPPYEVAAAQFLLGQALPYFPAGTVYLVIVDPGVVARLTVRHGTCLGWCEAGFSCPISPPFPLA